MTVVQQKKLQKQQKKRQWKRKRKKKEVCSNSHLCSSYGIITKTINPHVKPKRRRETSYVQDSDKVASDVKASMSAELERWRKLKSPKEQDKLLADYFYDALKSMSMAEKEKMVTVLLARNCSAKKK